ncbi:MAG: hypothetical protein V4505_25605 [Pseudomonadota bacterium]
MNVIIRLGDNVALYRGDDLSLTASCASGDGWADPTTTAANAVLTEGGTLPADWIGGAYSYAGGEWTLVDASLIPKAPVPESVPKKNGKKAILMSGHWDALMTFVNALPTEQKVAALFELNDSETYRRDDDFLKEAAAGIGLTDIDLDHLFILAGSL